MVEKVKISEKFEGCTAYDCGTVLYILLAKGTTVSDHTHKHKETIFLMEGEVEALIGSEKVKITAPGKITIPKNTYHKFTAITDTIGLEIKNNWIDRLLS